MNKVIAIGEILFDKINTKEYLGGAPFNYLYHIHFLSRIFKLSLFPQIISKIGSDERGNIIKKKFEEIDFPTQLLQVCSDFETGLVIAEKGSNNATKYNILENVAYDYIDESPNTKEFISKEVEFFYFGTLFQRTSHNRRTLAKYLLDGDNFHKNVLFDINLRQDYYNWDVIDDSLVECDFLKINHEELNILKNRFFHHKSYYYDQDFIFYLIENYGLQKVILTRAEKGAAIYNSDGTFQEREGKTITKIKDTIGAGDAFSSIFTIGIILDWNDTQILKRAIDFSSEVCKLNGAIPDNVEWYFQFSDWFE